MTLNIGDLAPDFTLATETGAALTLSTLRGRKIILYFYPKDHTPGCTQEACDFRDHTPALQHKNAVVLGISKDSSATHQKFITKHALPFTLLVDQNASVCLAYGVMSEKSLFGKTFLGIKRSTFLIDEQGLIQAIWRKVKVKGHVEAILNELN